MAAPPLPKLPGYAVSLPREEPNQLVRDLAPEATQTLSATQLTGTLDSPSRGIAGSTGKLPQWVENDRKVLRFYGYFQESIPESRIENHRVRKLILYYYLEDDSMHIAEPREDNSGIPQGVFVKRHKVTKDDGSFFSPAEFSVGEELTVYAKTFFLTDADSFTRDWYQANLGKELGAPHGYPHDPIEDYRKTFGMNRGRKTEASPDSTADRDNDFKAYMEASLGKASHMIGEDKLRQWLENNKKVLRFFCVWDNRQGMYGDRRPYVLNFYLEDDTVEILEVQDSNNGRDPYPQFLKRGRMPKTLTAMGPSNVGFKPKADNCYHPGDLRLGQYITVLGRDFLLHDCDGFTKRWYMSNLGFTEEELQQVEIKEPNTPLAKPALAPFNGYGTIEDSLQNCLSLIPKPPRRDMHKLMNKDKIILRFKIKMIETDKHKHSGIDMTRRFVLSYFMMDDTLMIFEEPVRNSGVTGGRFLDRQKIYKPQSEEIFTYLDLYVGGTIVVFHRTFEMDEADEYTLTYMENNKHIFIMADTEILLKSLRAQVSGREEALRSAFIQSDRNGTGMLNLDELEGALASAGLKFTRHQATTLRRRLENAGGTSIESFLGVLGLTK